LAYESGVTRPVDPLGGSYYVESLTDALDGLVNAELAEIDRRGGTLAALADGYQQGEIAQAAYEFQRAVEAGEAIVVGVNAFNEGGDEQRPAPQAIDPEAEARQVARTHAVRAGRDQAAAAAAVAALSEAAAGTENVLPRILACVESLVTLGEISDALRGVWGEHRP
jgi:methylmalonyl-CoA mutase N-terminal domain/subunit